MKKHVIKKDQTAMVWIDEGNSEWIVQKGVTLSGSGAALVNNFDGVTFTIAGKITTDGDGIMSVGSMDGESADNTSVNVTSTGRILSDDSGIVIEGTGAKVMNAGVIRSETDHGIHFQAGDVIVKNKGKITSEEKRAINIADSTGFLIKNDGVLATISGDEAIDAKTSGAGKVVNGIEGVINGSVIFSGSDGNLTLINRGEITGDDKKAVHLSEGDDHFVNHGRITGLIALFDGDDTADLRKGKLIDSEVQGGDGDDVYIVDKANISISEANGNGYDTVKTTVSFTLDNDGAGNDEIEVLQAIGKKNLNLTGNNGDNILNGNSGDNKLSGGDGIDILWGHGGNDILTGGDDVDLFYFAAKSGVDKILDFTINEDEIRLVKIAGIDDFDDLENRMKMVDTDGDGETDDATVINLGHGNRITLVGIDKDDLGGGDFDIL